MARQFMEAAMYWQRQHDRCEPVRPGNAEHLAHRDIAQEAARALLREADKAEADEAANFSERGR